MLTPPMPPAGVEPPAPGGLSCLPRRRTRRPAPRRRHRDLLASRLRPEATPDAIDDARAPIFDSSFFLGTGAELPKPCIRPVE